MSYSIDEMALGKAWYHRRAKVFFALMVASLVMTAFAVAMIITSEEDKGAGIVGTVEVGIVAVVFLILWARMHYGEKSSGLALKRGSAVAAVLKESMPDFEATNEFVIHPYDKRSPKVWVSQEQGQIQFLLSDPNPVHAWKKERLRKTKCMKVTSLLDIDLKVAHETITSFGAYGINPLDKTTLIAGGGTKATRTVGYYSVDFLFDDVDLPFVSICFGRNSDGAKKLFYAVKALQQRGETSD